MAESEITHLSDLHFDARNPRRHTPRNIGMILASLQEVGAARSIVIDEDATILAGNGTVEAAALAGIERVRVIDADGDELIAVRRRSLTTEQQDRLSLYDNRTGELAEWDPLVIQQEHQAGLSFKYIFDEAELAAIARAAQREADEPFTPNLRPSVGVHDVTAHDVARAQHDLEHRFERPQVLLEVVCAGCGATFFVEKQRHAITG